MASGRIGIAGGGRSQGSPSEAGKAQAVTKPASLRARPLWTVSSGLGTNVAAVARSTWYVIRFLM